MKIGMIDLDGKNNKKPFPNLALMKLSAWHKNQGDSVEWYDPLLSGHMNKVYVSKVFSFTPNYEFCIDTDEVVYGGSGFAIRMENGHEIYDKSKDNSLSEYVEHIFPDYSLYGITDTAYGFLSKGCPRGCSFCHVQSMQGCNSHKVADLSEFWNGQKNIVLLDPNITACNQWENLLSQLIDSKASVDFSQGLDIRLMTDEKAEMLKQINCKRVHFAWDNYEDKEIIVPKLERFKQITNWDYRKCIVYMLVGDRERKVTSCDLERIYALRDLGFNPYVMIYDKFGLPARHELKQLQRWVNNRIIFRTVPRFEDYLKGG